MYVLVPSSLSSLSFLFLFSPLLWQGKKRDRWWLFVRFFGCLRKHMISMYLTLHAKACVCSGGGGGIRFCWLGCRWRWCGGGGGFQWSRWYDVMLLRCICFWWYDDDTRLTIHCNILSFSFSSISLFKWSAPRSHHYKKMYTQSSHKPLLSSFYDNAKGKHTHCCCMYECVSEREIYLNLHFPIFTHTTKHGQTVKSRQLRTSVSF